MAEVRIVEKNHYFRQKLASCSFFATNKAPLSSFFFYENDLHNTDIWRPDRENGKSKIKKKKKCIHIDTLILFTIFSSR